MRIRIIILFLTSFLTLQAQTQLKGLVIDDQTGDTLAYAGVLYKGHRIGLSADKHGRFVINRHNGWTLHISAMGYITQKIQITPDTPNDLTIRLAPDNKQLKEVVVKQKKLKYKRKENPAVELMRRVIAAKKRTRLENHDYYTFTKYQKLKFGFNDIKPEQLNFGIFAQYPWLTTYVEACEENGKLIMPISVDETVTQRVYRKSPEEKKDIIKGQRTDGISNLIQTGQMMNDVLKDLFQDVDIYEDHIKMLQQRFTSPIGETAISFFHYYIEDTVKIENDSCIHLHFLPANQQDIGFRGDIYIVKDSSLHVKRCELFVPKMTDLNFLESMRVNQVYSKLPNGEWVLTTDDMFAELKIFDIMDKGVVKRTTRLSDYSFDELPKKLFKGKAKVKLDIDAKNRDEAFWQQNRQAEMTKSEAEMPNFIKNMQKSPDFKWIVLAARIFLENFIETGTENKPSKFDIGPVNTALSYNFVDAFRFQLGGRTTANLNKHWYWNGFSAFGVRSRKFYYNSELTYSFNKKEYQPFEFPQRTIALETTYDVMSPSDLFIHHNKNNMFMAIRTQQVKQMYFFKRQKLSFTYETDGGFGVNASFKRESNMPTGDLYFQRLSDDMLVKKIHKTELTAGLSFAPGQKYSNSKTQRVNVNNDAPHLAINHTVAFDGLMGGQYKYNRTEVDLYKRFWLGSFGYLNTYVQAGAQWNKVPFPLLIMPHVNLSFFEHENTFSMMRNMEFLNDRYALWAIAWHPNGKIFNRIPGFKKLKCREYFGLKGMWGSLTDKNNPFLVQNRKDNMLFYFPDGAHVMDKHTPYLEGAAGIHNILRFFAIDFIYRFTYQELHHVEKLGVRFGFEITF